MHHAPMHFIYETKILYPELFKNKRWLEIGSGNGNPKAKTHTENSEWVGVDLEEGDNVDVVSLGHLYKDDEYWIRPLDKDVSNVFKPETIKHLKKERCQDG